MGLEHLVDEMRIRSVVQHEQMGEDIDARVFERRGARAARTDRHQPQLGEDPKGFAHGAAVDHEPFSQLALGRKTIAGPVAPPQDVTAQRADDTLDAAGKARLCHGGGSRVRVVGRAGLTELV